MDDLPDKQAMDRQANERTGGRTEGGTHVVSDRRMVGHASVSEDQKNNERMDGLGIAFPCASCLEKTARRIPAGPSSQHQVDSFFFSI